MKYSHYIIFSFIAFFACVNTVKAAEYTNTPLIKVFNSKDFAFEYDFEPFPESTAIHSIDIEMADLGKDGFDEFIVSAGAGHAPTVRIFDKEGNMINEFLAYAEHFQGGVHITAKDIDDDGVIEIVTAAQDKGGPHVRIFDSYGNVEGGFFAFDKDLRGGVNLGVGDLHPSQGLEIVTASGRGMDALIKVFNRYGDLLYEFQPSFPGIRYGLNVQVVDLERDGQSEIIVSAKAGYNPITKVYTPDGVLIREFSAYQNSFQGGVNLEFAQLRVDAPYEIITGAGFGGGAHVRFFDYQGNPIIKPDFFVFEGFGGGVLVESGNVSITNGNEVIVATQFNPLPGKDKNFQMIEVSLEDQELITYEFGRERDRSLVSTGISKFPTPQGAFQVTAKIEEKTYEWSYGPDHPDNYEIDDVKHNLRFNWPYYLHAAYWHNNFGNPMSHGCVNLPLDYAEKLYEWASVGTHVSVQKSFIVDSIELAQN
jgi:hypothetical protein